MKKKSILTALGLATLLAGAASANQVQLATSIKETRVEAGRTRDQLVATLATLTALTKQEKGDLHPAYQAYCTEVPKTEAAAAATRARIVWMQGDGMRYFESWQKTIDTINNPSLKKQSQKRLEAVKKSYLKVITSFQQAGEKFKPFLADLGDIQTDQRRHRQRSQGHPRDGQRRELAVQSGQPEYQRRLGRDAEDGEIVVH